MQDLCGHAFQLTLGPAIPVPALAITDGGLRFLGLLGEVKSDDDDVPRLTERCSYLRSKAWYMYPSSSLVKLRQIQRNLLTRYRVATTLSNNASNTAFTLFPSFAEVSK